MMLEIQPKRQFAHQKFLILLLFVLKIQIEEEPIEYITHFQEDLQFCSKCFRNQSENCEKLFQEIEQHNELGLQQLLSFFVPIGLRGRQTSLLKIKHSKTKIISKYLVKDKAQYSALKAQPLKLETLKSRFLNESRLNGIQFCPHTSVKRFIALFKPKYNTFTIWLYLLLNVQPMLLPFLSQRGFPVPHHYASCGFSIFQEHAGKSLHSYYGTKDYYVRLRIAKQLLEAALNFTKGFEGFRVYVTDLNADNVVYNQALDRLTFVDLDTVFIVDSQQVAIGLPPHKHQYIECMDCFAYSPQDICKRPTSDLNIFAACQLLREDLKKDVTRGFLHPIPKQYYFMKMYLNECVDCAGSKNRFAVARKLITAINEILVKNL